MCRVFQAKVVSCRRMQGAGNPSGQPGGNAVGQFSKDAAREPGGIAAGRFSGNTADQPGGSVPGQGRELWEIILDRSAFFPEGGGQDGDRGYLLLLQDNADPAEDSTSAAGINDTADPAEDSSSAAGINDTADPAEASPSAAGIKKPSDPAELSSPCYSVRVLDSQERGDDILLICDSPLQEGASVEGHLDWLFRFDRMQNHSGEHIVSGLIHSRFGYENVGFHMSSDRMTIDLSGDLTDEQLQEIELKANEVVWADLPVVTDVYTEEEAENVEFRSKKQLHGSIRVVTMPGADVCACCGTHVLRTGQIGSIRIISHVRFKGGIRMELACGRWAYLYMSHIFRENHKVSMILSAKMTETSSAAQKLLDDGNAVKYRMTMMQYEAIDRKAAQLQGAGDIILFAQSYSPVLVQKLTAKVMEECKGKCISFSGTDEEGYRYAAGEKDGNMKDLIQKMNKSLNGRGGGKPFFLQGSVNAGRKDIEEWLRCEVPSFRVLDME